MKQKIFTVNSQKNSVKIYNNSPSKCLFFFSFFLVFFSSLLFCEPCNLDYKYPENSPLYFGNPSDATTEIENEQNFLLKKNGYTISYNNYLHIPNWVAWHLSKEDLGEISRSDKFVPDNSLPKEWYKVKKSDYQFPLYGFDRGHVCPSADRTSTQEQNQETFFMTNMIPQSPDCNRIVWKDLENFERELVYEGNELYIFAGGYGTGGIGKEGYYEKIIVSQKEDEQIVINIPEFCWKIILIISDGNDDINRIDNNTKIISVFIPNQQNIHKTGSWEQYECSVNYIEEITKFDFFELIPNDIEETIENNF